MTSTNNGHAAHAAATVGTIAPDRSAWAAAQASLAQALAADRELDAQHTAAQRDGTVTPELEQAWSDSADALGSAEWALFETEAPDISAISWKIAMLSNHGLLQEDFADRLRADINRITNTGVR